MTIVINGDEIVINIDEVVISVDDNDNIVDVASSPPVVLLHLLNERQVIGSLADVAAGVRFRDQRMQLFVVGLAPARRLEQFDRLSIDGGVDQDQPRIVVAADDRVVEREQHDADQHEMQQRLARPLRWPVPLQGWMGHLHRKARMRKTPRVRGV